MLWVLGDTGDPFEAARTQLTQVGRHGVDEIIRVCASRMHTDFRMHFAGAVRMLDHRLLNSSDHFGEVEIKADDVFLRQEENFDRLHRAFCHWTVPPAAHRLLFKARKLSGHPLTARN